MRGDRGIHWNRVSKSELLFICVVVIFTATVSIYDGMIYEEPLRVGSSTSGPPTTSGLGLSTTILLTVAMVTFGVSLFAIWFLPVAYRRFAQFRKGRVSERQEKNSLHDAIEGWEEFPGKEEEPQPVS